MPGRRYGRAVTRRSRPRWAALALAAGLVVAGMPIAPAALAAPLASELWMVGQRVFGLTQHIGSDTATFSSRTRAPGAPWWAFVTVFRTTPNVDGHLDLWEAGGTGPATGTIADVQAEYTPDEPGAEFRPFCNGGFDGRYVVHEVEYGPDHETLRLAADLVGSCDGLTMNVAIRHNATYPVRSFQVSSEALTLPDAAPGETGPPERLTIESNGTDPVTFAAAALIRSRDTGIRISADTCSGATIAVGATCWIDVTHTPRRPGTRDAVLRLTTVDGLAPSLDIPVQAHGTAVTSLSGGASASVVIWPDQPTMWYRLAPGTAGGSVHAVLDEGPIAKVAGPAFGAATRTFTWPKVGSGLLPGPHTFWLDYPGDPDHLASSTPTFVVTVLARTVTTLTSTRAPGVVGEPVTYTATVALDPPDWWPPLWLAGGTLSIIDRTTGTTLRSVAVTSAVHSAQVTTLPTTTGPHAIEAVYEPAPDSLVSGSMRTLTQQVVADTAVRVSGLGTTLPKFYPVADGYRDTVGIQATPIESLTASIAIYTPGGTRIRKVDLGTRSSAYTWTWDGRSDGGTLQSAGRFRIVQSFRDGVGNMLADTRYVDLSKQRLVDKTWSKTVDGEDFLGAGGTVSRTGSTYARGVLLDSVIGWAAVNYRYHPPSAISYTSMKFTAWGKSPNGQQGIIGVHDPTQGHSLDLGSYRSLKAVGPGYDDWATTSTTVARDSAGDLYGLVYVQYGLTFARFDVQKARLTVVYRVLE